jgi:hypothetical protein
MAGEGTIRDRTRAARDRRREGYLHQRLERDRMNNQRVLPLVNRILGTHFTVDDLPQTVAEVGDSEGRVEYRFKVDGENFALLGDGSLYVLVQCPMCTRLAEAGKISLAVHAAIVETGGDELDLEGVLAELADLLDTKVYCWYHWQPEEPEHSELEARVRQLVREEIENADLADADHIHGEYADEHHVHYELADRDHGHDVDHSHDGEYASVYHYH